MKLAVEAAIWENRRKLGQLPYRRAKVVVTLWTMRLLDKDNAYASVKPIVDALTEYAVIEDDRMECLDLKVVQERVQHRDSEKVTMTVVPTELSF